MSIKMLYGKEPHLNTLVDVPLLTESPCHSASQVIPSTLTDSRTTHRQMCVRSNTLLRHQILLHR
jgi:hypothetical protein